MTITPVILSGGSGTRLWPLSRGDCPKQYLSLTGGESLLQQTLAMTCGHAGFAEPMVIGQEGHRFLLAQQAQDIACPLRAIVLEPASRNTAPAVAVAAEMLAASGETDDLMLILPADHCFENREAFLADVIDAAVAARAGWLVTFGVVPDHAETGYGYILPGPPLDNQSGVFRAERFVEKPDALRAEAFVEQGCLWNAGILLCSPRRMLEELSSHAPDVLAAAQQALQNASACQDFLHLAPSAFLACPAISIDHAVLEKTSSAGVRPVAVGWSDIGSWSALAEAGAAQADSDGNVLVGDAIAEATTNAYVHSANQLTVLLGVRDIVVVTTDDAVLVAGKDHCQKVRSVVENLRTDGRPEADMHARVHRPWGFYQSIDAGEKHQTKRLTVYPGQQLSLQQHRHRSEHWVVVGGTALVTRDGEDILLREAESIHLPLGCIHRLANPGWQNLNIIEVQNGDYLGEDDIIRFEDRYGRA